MPARTLAGHANISDNATDPSSWLENTHALMPDAIQPVEELLVVVYVAQLASAILVALQGPVRRRSDNEVNRSVVEPRQVSRIAKVKIMLGLIEGAWPRLSA